MADKGGEFADETCREVNEKLNMCYDTKAAESLKSNGTVECANALLSTPMMKMTYDTSARTVL